MAAFAPPIHRDSFLYSSLLYADAGNQNHHPRASIAELTALLRPEAPKSSKKAKISQSLDPAKDQVGHWYTAQLIHYGLPPTKDKNAAKVRLLNALNEGKLEVPAWIAKLEVEIKKEWEGENRKLKKAAKNSNAVRGTNTSGKDIKKKEPKATPSPNLSKAARIGVIQSSSTQGTGPKPSNQKRKRENTDAIEPVGSSKKAMPKKHDGPASSTTSAQSAAPSTSKAAIPAKKVAAAVDEDAWPVSTKNIIQHTGAYFIDFDPYRESRPASAPSAGVWKVSCPDVETDWPQDFIDEFYLAFSASEDEWWSRFRWGNFEGLMILQRIPKKTSKSIGVPFKWRARHSALAQDGEGTGKLFFNSQDAFKGELHSFFRQDPCYFQGKSAHITRRGGNGAPYPSSGTPVLDRLRVEWTEMPAVMRDAPAKKSRVKKETDNIESKAKVKKETVNAEPKPRIKAGNSATEPIFRALLKTVKTEPQDYVNPDDIVFSGTYKITCPQATKLFPDLDPSSLRLLLCRDETGNRWWASFSWGLWDGIIQMNPGPTYETLDQPCTLGWRLRDHSNGELRFGKRCTGRITFYRDCTIRANLYEIPEIGMVEFWGPRLPGLKTEHSGEAFQAEWDDFVTDVYGRY